MIPHLFRLSRVLASVLTRGRMALLYVASIGGLGRRCSPEPAKRAPSASPELVHRGLDPVDGWSRSRSAMKRPDPVLPQGTRVRTHDTLEPTDSLRIQPEHLAARTAGMTGTICGVVGVPWGDVYLVTHPGATVSAAYHHTEFEVDTPPEDGGKVAPVEKGPIESRGTAQTAVEKGTLKPLGFGTGMGVAVVDRLFIVVFGTADPSDDEWARYLELVERQGIARTAVLFWTDGGEPTPAQRRQLNDLLAGRNVPAAVVSESHQIRATVTALSWFNRNTRAFRASALNLALAYVEIPVSREGLIVRTISDLRATLKPREPR